MFKKVCTFSPLRHHNKGLKATSVEKASKYEGQVCSGAITGPTRMGINKINKINGYLLTYDFHK
jgi:hypothetical protein